MAIILSLIILPYFDIRSRRFYFSQNWDKLLLEESYKKLEDFVTRPYDVILLGCRAPWYRSWNMRILKSLSANAYLVNKDYYPTLLDNFKTGLGLFLESRDNEKHAVDTYWHRLMEVDEWFCILPSLMVQSESYSDIMNKKVNGRDDFW